MHLKPERFDLHPGTDRDTGKGRGRKGHGPWIPATEHLATALKHGSVGNGAADDGLRELLFTSEDEEVVQRG